MSRQIPVADAAKRFAIDQSTIYRYFRRGLLTRYRRGMDRRTYVDEGELRRLLTLKPTHNPNDESPSADA